MSNLQSKKLVLSDRFLIGEELGRGAYGQVYKGKDTTTGQNVAIKQISLSGASQENLQSVMGELELLKTLNHKNIVKYIGSFKTRTHLYIILEYMEYGALSSIIKPNRFGVFQEPLVAVYITQVLQGLAYLHAQGVVHRDIKGANILTTKEGLVKLADFGVAAKLGELEERNDELRQNVVGTPYWMAPEVIEMTQVTPASDIWSVGCLVIELLTGYPPYYDLQPMSALFRIVQDTHPPLPDNISPLLEDLLLKCFQKDPSLRPSAETLLQHEWVLHHRRTLRSSWNKAQGLRHRGQPTTTAHDNVSTVVNRMLQAESSGDEEAFVPAEPGSAGAALGPAASSRAAAAAGAGGVDTGLHTVDGTASALQTDTPVYEAFARDGGMAGTSTGAAAAAASDAQQQQQQQQQQRVVLPPPPSPRQPGELPRASSGVGATTTSSSSATGPPGSNIELATTSRHARSSSGAAGGSEAGRSSHAGVQQQQQQQLGRAPLQEGDGASIHSLPTHPQQQQQDGSGLPAQGAEMGQLRGPSAGGLPGSAVPPPLNRLGPFAADAGDSPLSTFLSRLQGDEGVCDTPSGAAASSSSHYLTAWLEEGPQRGSVRAGNSGKGWRDFGRVTPLGGYLSTEPSLSSDSGVSLNGLEGSDNSFVMESRRKVRDLVRSLRPGVKDANMTPPQACASLALMFSRQADSKQYFLSEGGVLAALELLDSDQPKCAEAALDLVLAFTANDTRLLEGLCLVGLVPLVCRLTWAGAGHAGSGVAASSSVGGGPGAGHERLRLKAAQLVQQLCCARETTLQMLIACGGLGHLVAMVQDNVQDPSTLTFIALSCIWRVLEAFGSLPINYICRILAHAGLVSRLHAVIKQLNTQARYAASRHTHSASSPLALDAGWDPSSDWGPGPTAAAGGGGAVGSQGLSSSMSERLGAAAGAGGRVSPGPDVSYGGSAAAAAAAADRSGLRTGESAHFLSRPMDSLEQNGVGGGGGSRLRPADATPGMPHSSSNANMPGLTHSSSNSRGEWLMDKCVSLLLVLAHADSVVKSNMCNKENVQSLLDATQRLAMPHLLKVMKALRWLSSDHSVVPALKDAGAIAQLVPFLSRDREGPAGQQELQLEALHVLYNICKFNRHVHLEVAATGGIVPHLCRLAADVASQGAQGGALAAAATPLAAAILAGDPLGNPMQLTPEQALAARRAAVRLHVVPMLIGLASTSSSTRAKLWASSGLDIFLMLLAESDGPLQVGILRAVCLWLSEDFGRVENKLIQRDTVGALVGLYGRACRARDTSLLAQLLDLLKTMLSRSSKLAVAMATGGLVPPLLELLGAPPAAVSPLLRAKLLEVIRVLYEHYPRPKEFIIKYKIQEVLRRLLELQGRGDDAVKLEAQKLLNAFHINVLL